MVPLLVVFQDFGMSQVFLLFMHNKLYNTINWQLNKKPFKLQ